MPPKPEDVLKLADDLVKAKKVLDDLQAKWDSIFIPTPANAPSSRATRDGSFSSQAEAVITGEPGRAFTIGQVANALGTEDTLKVGRTLFRLYNTGRIANPTRGCYSSKPVLEAVV